MSSDLSDQHGDPPPSTYLDPEALDAAAVVMVLHTDGSATASIAAGVDHAVVAAWLTACAASLTGT